MKVTIESGIALTVSAQSHVNYVLRAYEVMHANTPLTHAKMTQLTASPLVYRYRIQLQDARLWIQDIKFDSYDDMNPMQGFAVADPGLRASEYELHRPIREHLIHLVHGCHLIKFEVVS